jgi:hypothetical protein
MAAQKNAASSWGRFTSLPEVVGKCFVQGQPFELADLVLINFPTTIPALPPRGLGQTSPQIGPSRPDRAPA